MTDWKTWFKDEKEFMEYQWFSHQKPYPIYEQIYQAFKARFIEEMEQEKNRSPEDTLQEFDDKFWMKIKREVNDTK